MSKGSIRQISDNPAGQGRQCTPLILIREKKDNKTIYINLSAKNKLRN